MTMKILMLLDNEFPPDVRVESEAQSLLKENHSVHILSYTFGKKPENEIYNGIMVHRFRIQKQVAKKSVALVNNIPVYKCIWKKQIKRLLNHESFDAVHIHDLPLCSLAKFIRKNWNVKIVADMHENYPYLVSDQPYMKTLFGKLFISKKKWFVKEKEWLGNFNEIVCVAPEMKMRLAEILDPKTSFKVVPNTLGFDSFVASQEPIEGLKERFRDFFTILYIGGFDTLRGIEYLLGAAAVLKDKIPNMRILLVGSGSNIQLLKEMTQKLQIENQVVFEGWQSQDHIQAYIEVADICVIPHLKTKHTDSTSSNKLFQYMFFAKPVVSSNCGPLEKVINEEQCGLVYTDRNSEDFAEKLFSIYSNPMMMEEMGKRGRKAVLEKYNWSCTVQPLLDIYKGTK